MKEALNEATAALNKKTVVIDAQHDALALAEKNLATATIVHGAVGYLATVIKDGILPDGIQKFANEVLVLCSTPSTDEVMLTRKSTCGKQSIRTKYVKRRETRQLKANASVTLRQQWVLEKAHKMIALIGSVLNEYF